MKWAYVLYEPAYDTSASYTYEIKENSTFSTLYCVKYRNANQILKQMQHYDTINGFIEEKGLDPKKYVADKFLENTSISVNGNTISVYLSKMSEEGIELHKAYIEYAVNLINNQLREELIPTLTSTKALIEEDINELTGLSFKSEETSNTNYQKIISLKVDFIDICMSLHVWINHNGIQNYKWN